jgi:cell division protein FtsW
MSETTTKRNVQSWTTHPFFDQRVIVFATICLTVLGLAMVSSTGSIESLKMGKGSFYLFSRQVIFAIVGWGAWAFIQRVQIERLRKLSNLAFLFVIALLVVVLFIGSETYGQRNWIELGSGLRIQPSELAKPVMIFWAADKLSRKYELLHIKRELFYPVVPGLALVVALVVAEGDLGSAMILTPIVMAMFFYVGAPMKWFAIPISLGLVSLTIFTLAAGYRVQRFAAWLNPRGEALDGGYQLLHGYYAMGSGGWFGVGLGGSKEKLGSLPEAHTDFIFAVIGEELGILGTLSVIFFFAAIAMSSIRMAARTRDSFKQLTIMGIVAWIMTQALVNIGTVLGIIPITGVTIPLVSYGGSSLIPTIAAFGLLARLSREIYIENKMRTDKVVAQ